jgi:hypothetical protein
MADAFLSLPVEDRREALRVAADRSGRPAHLLEKDVWVVWALATLFGSDIGAHLVFKGGTSLSKAYGVIRRFSEDVDLTYDIRAIAPDLVGENGEALPKNRSEEKRWSKAVRHRPRMDSRHGPASRRQRDRRAVACSNPQSGRRSALHRL